MDIKCIKDVKKAFIFRNLGGGYANGIIVRRRKAQHHIPHQHIQSYMSAGERKKMQGTKECSIPRL
jgi:hypothetical protein